MKLQIIRTGKLAQTDLLPLVADYKKRINGFIRAEELEIKADSGRDKRNFNKSTLPLYEKSPGEFLILLDERGKQYTSKQFAENLQTWIDDPKLKTLSFLIGPPYGFDDATRMSADAKWSLASMTMPSDFAWLLTWEQVYRAMTILKGMPYHHD